MASKVSARLVTTIESPCIQVCEIDPGTRLCRGCRRSIDEIAVWSSMTPAERTLVMQDLRRRGAAPTELDTGLETGTR